MANNFTAEEEVFHKRRMRSESVLVLLCALAMLVVILAVTLIQNAYGVSMPWIQFIIFVLTVVVCYFLFRRHITRFHYRVDEETFTADKIVSKKTSLLCQVPFSKMQSISPYTDADKALIQINASGASKRQSLVIRFRADDGALKAVRISPTDDIRAQLEYNFQYIKSTKTE